MADTEIVVQAQSTAFQRTGQSFHRKGYVFSPTIGDYLFAAYAGSTPGLGLSALEQAFTFSLMQQDPTVIPGGLTLKNVQSIFPSAFNGAADLQVIYQKNPWSTEFETGTRALYERQYDKARAAAQSGPTNVRGATARQAFELASLDVEMSNNRFREIWQAQLAVAQIIVAAVQTASQVESERWRLQLQAQQQQAATEQGRVVQGLSASENLARTREVNVRALGAAVEFLGQAQMGIEEDLIGEGVQSSAQTGFGTSYWR